MKISINNNLKLEGEIIIPSSKSISNRALIIEALSKKSIRLENLSISDDTKILQKALEKINKKSKQTINVGMAGTAFRFLTAFLSIQKGTFILTGHQRIKERPIKPLVNSLILLGAKIKYLEKEGFAPLKIEGTILNSKTLEIDASISSQFITALMLIAPKIKNGIKINLIGEIASKSYIEMTSKMINFFGIQSFVSENKIQINEGNYKPKNLFIEADWSSASYFYQCLSLAENGELFLANYNEKSIQGDVATAKIFTDLGIKTVYKENGLILKKTKTNLSYFKYNFINQPDLAQTIICTCVALGIEGEFSGLESLKIKETDRIYALKTEINKLGWDLVEKQPSIYYLKIKGKRLAKSISFDTYNDHRMAMSLAPLCLKYGKIEIKNPKVVSKSNPLFWKLLKDLGFDLEL